MIREFFNKLKQRYRELNEFLAKYPILDWEELYFIQEYEAAKEKIRLMEKSPMYRYLYSGDSI